jgi:hypothetical protein
MKQLIELLEEAKKDLQTGPGGMFYADQMWAARRVIEKAIYILRHPRWETVEQYEKRTGEKWPDGWAVYTLYEYNTNGKRWVFCESYHYAVLTPCEGSRVVAIVCATEAGPPPDTWVPEAKQ